MAEVAAGLVLGIPKCVLIPIAQKPTCHVISVIRDWLATHVSTWAGFALAGTGEYLGIWMGPLSNTRQWQKTYEKGDMR
eukprot:4014586-Karenia_brevis.AAC.1